MTLVIGPDRRHENLIDIPKDKPDLPNPEIHLSKIVLLPYLQRALSAW